MTDEEKPKKKRKSKQPKEPKPTTPDVLLEHIPGQLVRYLTTDDASGLTIEVTIKDAPRMPAYDEMWRRILMPPPPKPAEPDETSPEDKTNG